MADIGYTVIDFILKMIIVAGISATLLLLGAAAVLAWYWSHKK